MASVTLNQIYCHQVEDYDGADELKLEVYIDGILKEVFRHSMLPRRSWQLDRNYAFEEILIFRIWEEDGQDKQLLAEQSIKIQAKKGRREKKYKNAHAVYWLQYTVENTPAFVKKTRTKLETLSKGGKVRAGKVKSGKPVPKRKKPSRASGGGIEVKRDEQLPDFKTIDSAIVTFEEFMPSLHGLPFKNKFKFKLNFPLPFIPKIASTYGLCGGMSSLAADCFKTQKTIPGTHAVPKIGSGLYVDLMDRQLKSFGKNFMYILKFFQWWRMLSTFQTQQKSLEEWQELKQSLDAGQPCQLGLMYVDEHSGSLWDNHQVLAYGYEQPNDKLIYLRIYDPNYPKRDDVFVKCTLDNSSNGKTNVTRMVCEQHVPNRGSRKVRGFFCLPMKHIKPAY